MFPHTPLQLHQAPAWVALATLPLLVLANWQLARVPREAGSLAPPWMARLFSVLLALSLLAGLASTRSGPDLPSTLHALGTTVLALCALRITWRVDQGRLGFSDMRFALAYLVCEAGQLLVFSPTAPDGASLLGLLALLLPYGPPVWMGHDWFASRVITTALARAVGQWLVPAEWLATRLPAFLGDSLAGLREGAAGAIFLGLEIASVAWVVQCRFSEWPHRRLGPQALTPASQTLPAAQPPL